MLRLKVRTWAVEVCLWLEETLTLSKIFFFSSVVFRAKDVNAQLLDGL